MASKSSNRKGENDGTLKRLVFGTGSLKRQKKKNYDEVYYLLILFHSRNVDSLKFNI